jgi:hypothetical protein
MAGNDSRVLAATGLLNYTAARALVGTVGQTIAVAGRVTAGDGGEGSFVWKAGAATDNDGTILLSTGGYWERIRLDDSYKPGWWGGSPSSANNTTALQLAIDTASGNGGGVVSMIEGVWTCTGDVSLSSYVQLAGASYGTVLKFTSGARLKTISTRSASLRNLKLWSTASTSALYVGTLANQALLRFDVIDCEIKADGTGNACVYLEGNTGTGGNGYVYWPSFLNCDFHGPGAANGATAILRYGSTGNGVLFTKVIGGRMTGAARHLDMQRCLNGRFVAVSHDDCFTGTGTGRFIYLGDYANANAFISAHFEESGIEIAVEFTPLCDQNSVDLATPMDFSHVVGLGLGVANKTEGFSQVSGADSNPNPYPTTFALLLQDEIREKTAANGVEIDGALLKDGALWGPVNTSAGVAALTPETGGSGYHAIMRPDGGGLQTAFFSGREQHYGVQRIYNTVGSVLGLDANTDSYVNTTNATPVNLISHTFVADNSVAVIDFTVCAYRTGGARGTGAVGDVAKFVRRVTAKRVAGTTTILATETAGADQADADLAAAAITVGAVVSSGAVVLRVTGAIDTNLKWAGLREARSNVTG